MSVFDGRDSSWWRYDFAATEVGAPFALAIDETIKFLVGAAAIVDSGELLLLTERGTKQFDLLRNLRSFRERERYLSVSCSETLAMPLPMLTEAVTREPQLKAAVQLNKSRRLLDLTGIHVLQPHFDGIRQVLRESGHSEDSEDLFVPLSLWLVYLSFESDVA